MKKKRMQAHSGNGDEPFFVLGILEMNDTQKTLERAVERSTKIPINELRRMSVEEIRKKTEKEKGEKCKFYYDMKQNLLTREQIEEDLDYALRDDD